MKFVIEQVAIFPPNAEAAMELLSAMGMDEWTTDQVAASGLVFGGDAKNVANLNFNYQASNTANKLEFEVLEYISGRHWMAGKERRCSVSHLGMHCTNAELVEWRKFFAERGIDVAQEVFTVSHTNPAIAETRRYNYVIFATKSILGVDLKFIVRWNTVE